MNTRLTDDHTYLTLLRDIRHLCSGDNLTWVDKFLAAAPATRKRMLTMRRLAAEQAERERRKPK